MYADRLYMDTVWLHSRPGCNVVNSAVTSKAVYMKKKASCGVPEVGSVWKSYAKNFTLISNGI